MKFRTLSSFAVMTVLLLSAPAEGAATPRPEGAADMLEVTASRRAIERIDLNVENPDTMARRQMIRRLRAASEHCIFLSGGAGKMTEEDQAKLLGLLEALTILSDRGLSIVVGDGGTEAGIMKAAGDARARAKRPFPLIGIPPAPNLVGSTVEGMELFPVDPNHSHLVAVLDAAWPEKQADYGWEPSWGYWGSETETMYSIFADLAEGRSSVTIVANGGGITLDEVSQNIQQRRRMIVIKGSGRAADAICCLIEGTEAQDEEVAKRMKKAVKIGVPEHRELFALFDMAAGPEALANVLQVLLEGATAR